jgi:hypothetical protein
MKDILIGFGSELKLLPNGHIGGYLVRFTDKNSPDLAGDYFDADTDFGFEGEIKSPVFLNHRLPLETANGKKIAVKEKIGEATLKKADDGIVIDAILYERKRYEKALKEMGWSSGTASHLSDRTKMGKSFHVDVWPLGLDASITPTPCDPNNICSLKSYSAAALKSDVTPDDPSKSITLAARLNRRLDDLTDDGHDKTETVKRMAREAMCEVSEVESILDGSKRRPSNAHLKAFARVLATPYDMLRSLAERQRKDPQTIKSAFDDMVAEEMAEGPCAYELFSYYAKLSRDIQTMASASQTTGTPFDVNMKVHELASAFLPHLEHTTVAQILDSLEPHDDNALYDPNEFYLKALTKLDVDTFRNLTKGIDLDTHSELVVSAFRDISARLKNNQLARANQKAGREISDKNRTRAADILAALKQSVSDFESWLESTKPMATDEAMRAAKQSYLRLKFERETGVTL